jgi:hypothetical protein
MRLVTPAKKRGDGRNVKLKRRRPLLGQSSAVSRRPSALLSRGPEPPRGSLPMGFSGFPLLTIE